MPVRIAWLIATRHAKPSEILALTFTDKAAEEMTRKEHYFGGTEYERYAKENRENLYEEGVSVRYESPEQLIRLGLICRGNWL